MQRLQIISCISLHSSSHLYFFNIIIVTTRINLRQNKLPWIYDCPAQCPNIEWYFLQTCCFYKLTPAGKMIFRVHFGIREYPAIQVFTITFIWIIATSQGAQLTCIGSKWVGEKLEHFEDFPVSCSRSSLWSWDKVFCLALTTGMILGVFSVEWSRGIIGRRVSRRWRNPGGQVVTCEYPKNIEPGSLLWSPCFDI